MTLLLLACAGEPAPGPAEPEARRPFAVDDALAPALAALDTDGDGRVGAGEWARTAPSGPSFGRVDQDRDGALSKGELAMVLNAIDPHQWEAPRPRRVPDEAAAKMTYPRTWEERMAADRAAFREEVAAAAK
ncbi:MAG: hypothetical protein ACOZNI_25820 [Myxococcota bacterium]